MLSSPTSTTDTLFGGGGIIAHRSSTGRGETRHRQPCTLADFLGVDLHLDGLGNAALCENALDGVVSDVVGVGRGAATCEVHGTAAD